ncbi:MAG: MarR family transcriptional regulator [Pseudomonadota bacterium]|nr:MarR family transcriptional regulator [Pseudomonadota bacterium]
MHDSLIASKLEALAALVAETAEGEGARAGASAAALLTLRHHGPLATTALARVLGVTQPAATRLLDRLAADGLVARDRPSGRREGAVALTPEGRAEAEGLQAARLAALAALLAPLPEPTRRGFVEGLDALLSAAVRDRTQARRLCRFCDHGVCDGPVCPIGRAASRIEAETQEPPR